MIRLILFTTLLNCFLISLAQNSPLTDGPYVFYNSRQVIIRSVNNGVFTSDTLVEKNTKDKHLKVMLTGDTGLPFTVTLKQSLQPEPSVYSGVERMFVLSDIEGTFEGFYRLLLKGGVIDEEYNWMFGNGHLVVCGDIFDRGDEVTACLWLLYKLENNAKAKDPYTMV